MTDNAKHDYAEFYPADFPWDGAFVVRDIQRKDWWPYRPVDGVVDALWLLGDDAAPDGLFGKLIETWGRTVGWFLAGLSDPHLDEEKISWPFTDEVFNGHRVGRVRYEALQGIFLFHRHLECWQITPNAEDLHGLLRGPVWHPREGWWLAASPDPDAGSAFVKATTSLLWWALKDYEPYEGATLEVVGESVKEALLGLLPQIGLMSVVPLNNHPVSGVVIFGTPEAIQDTASSVGGIRESQGEEFVRIWNHAGWLVTL